MKSGFERLFFPMLLWLALGGGGLQARTFILRTEDLEMPGGWSVESDAGAGKGARRYLIAPTAEVAKAPAVGAVEIPAAGKWRVWVRSKDYVKDRPGSRFFTLRVGAVTLGRNFGTHGQAGDDGWAWEDGGVVEMAAGPLLVVLGEQCRHSARCDALVFTDNLGYVPEGVSWLLQKGPAKAVDVVLGDSSKQQFTPPPMTTVLAQPVAFLENEKLRVTFHEGEAGSAKAVGMKVAMATGARGGWQGLSEDAGVASYRVLFRPLEKDPAISRAKVYPAWDTSMSPTVEVRAGLAKANTRLGPASTPWLAGTCLPMRPVRAVQKDAQTVELGFAPSAAGQLYVTWVLEPGQEDVLVRMTFKPVRPGHCSIGFHGPLAVAAEQADSWLLPFQFHGKRFPKDPVLLLNSTTPTPMTLLAHDGVSCALAADPGMIPFEWQGADTARYGFGLRNEAGLAQPLVYAPVLGLPGSRSEDGRAVSSRFRFLAKRGGWYETYREVADGLFELKDYREPTTFSLTDTVFNLMELMRDEAASGWDARAKGSVQIESRNVVTQSSPLVYLSLYLLTGDVDFYNRFARPSLEFLLSRPEAHFAVEKEIGDNYYRHQPMEGPVKLYGSATYASALAMTQGRTPALGEQALLADGRLRRTPPNSHAQPFDDALVLYHVTGEQHWLEQAVQEADKYLAMQKEKTALTDPGDRYFVNVTYAGNWEGLLHLHEATQEPRFLEAAQEHARSLLTTVWTQPVITAKMVRLNPGGVYDHARSIWWWGDGRKRVGVHDGPAVEGPIDTPAPKIAERVVPAWTVSNVGLGLEHPFTYVRSKGQGNILMSVWAANFLRLSRATGDPAFGVAARNSMIGRFANYPGYYLDGQTDEFRRADYPLKGPDITSLYVHHIAPFTASVLDFLFTDVEMRSQGAVAFPSVRQMGYVWFDSRIWGHAPGSVYGQAAWPWLHRTAVRLDNPKVDHLLAQGDGKLHVMLMNQSLQPQTVRVTFDETLLGAGLPGAALVARLNNELAEPVAMTGGVAVVTLPVKGLLVLTREEVTVDVPTQRGVPPAKMVLAAPGTGRPALQRAVMAGTKWQVTATMIEVPPFEWRDFYAYVNSMLGEVKSATLRYRMDDGAEQSLTVDRFPFEFSVRVEEAASVAMTWEIEVVTSDGARHGTGWQTTGGR